MGFMDKAKQMAEQAQQKIDEAQKQFNESQAQRGQQQGGASVHYDKHGRPVEDAPAAATPPAPVGNEPAAPAEQAAPAEPAVADEQPVPPPAPPKDGVNTAPDPFKPIE